jgi:uncharacterized repeat protein (TIGR03803 family)
MRSKIMIKLTSAVWGGCAAFVIAASAGGSAQAVSKETIIHNFANATGKSPITGPVVDASTGAFYGAMETGGTNGTGVVYQLLPPTATQPKWIYTIIYNNPADTQSSVRMSVNIYASNGVVYGFGGTGFLSLTAPGSGGGEWTPNVLYTFTESDGNELIGPLTMDRNGALYGTAFSGGTGCKTDGSCGTVFKLAPPAAQGQAWSLSVLYNFPGGAAGEKPADGVVLDKQGNLYGSTAFDYPSGKSLIFKLTPPSGAGEWKETVLYHFYPTTDCYFGGPLAIDANGALYGVFSAQGSLGSYCPSESSTEYAFQLKPSASNPNVWTKTEMRSFPYTGSAAAYKLTAPVTVDSSGNVYGATLAGGTSGEGTVFVLQPSAGVPGKWTYKTLFDFAAEGSNSPNANTTGAAPNGAYSIA